MIAHTTENKDTEKLKAKILELLQDVKDPEMPFISVVDLGIISNVVIQENGRILIKMTPTFVGCPAIEYMKNDIRETVIKAGFPDTTVEVDKKERWNSNKVTEKGKEQLKKFGLSAPRKHCGTISETDLEEAECPLCSGTNTELISPFGPTLCRALFYCNDCKQGFEQFKPVE